MKNDRVLSPLCQSVRQYNRSAIEFHLGRLLKKLNDPAVSPLLKTEIYLEVVNAFRVLNRAREAALYADTAVANIPAGSLDLLSALKRIRALLHLDENELEAALNLIAGCDGMELILEGGRSLITRNDDDVKVETWLVSTEIALVQRDLEEAQNYFNNAVNRLSGEEKTLRRKRINPMERKSCEQYYHDLGQTLSLFGLTIALLQKDEHARAGLQQLCCQVEEDNCLAAATRKLPNVPLHSKLLCLLGKWLPQSEQPPPGLTLSEARRWAEFAAADVAAMVVRESVAVLLPIEIPGSALPVVPDELQHVDAMTSDQRLPSVNSTGQAEKALDITTTALRRMSLVFEQFENLLPNVKSYMSNGYEPSDYSKRGFSGHLLDTDLYNFMQNFEALRFTGYLRLKWDKNLYQLLVIKGILPEIVRAGEAHIYVASGVVTDAVFDGQTASPTVAGAQENFILLVRMCLSIGVDDMRPEIVGCAVPEEAVALRPPQISVRVNDLLYITSDIESELAGIVEEKPESATDVPVAKPNNEVFAAEEKNAVSGSIVNPNPNSDVLSAHRRIENLPVVTSDAAVVRPTAESIAPDYMLPATQDNEMDTEDLFGFDDPPQKKPSGNQPAASIDPDDFWDI